MYSGLACLTCIVVCKNKNGICNQAELQTVAITEAGKGCSTRNRAKERALIMALVMSAYEAILQISRTSHLSLPRTPFLLHSCQEYTPLSPLPGGS